VQHTWWVHQLADAQLPDESWGRFHSRDTRTKTAFRTSEEAIQRTLALGLDIRDLILGRARQFILAGRLAQIDPDNPVLDIHWGYWSEVALRSFASGAYGLEDEVKVSQRFQGSMPPRVSWNASMPYGFSLPDRCLSISIGPWCLDLGKSRRHPVHSSLFARSTRSPDRFLVSIDNNPDPLYKLAGGHGPGAQPIMGTAQRAGVMGFRRRGSKTSRIPAIQHLAKARQPACRLLYMGIGAAAQGL
jgi:hypothetical protein